MNKILTLSFFGVIGGDTNPGTDRRVSDDRERFRPRLKENSAGDGIPKVAVVVAVVVDGVEDAVTETSFSDVPVSLGIRI